MTSNTDGKIYFERLLQEDTQKSTGVAAIETLVKALSESKATSAHELNTQLEQIINELLTSDKSTASIQSASELFLRFISLVRNELLDVEFDALMSVYKKRGQQFIRRISQSRSIISSLASPFVQHNAKIIIHSYSKNVLAALLEAKKRGHVFQIFVTESSPDFAGKKMHATLLQHGIDSIQILDSAVGYLMERMDAVLLGAEAVNENGGIINKIGSFGIAMIARTLNKKVYVLAESIKFVKEFPLNQSDIPEKFKYHASTLKNADSKALRAQHPLVDYTPPQFLDLLITDIGIFPPQIVSTELIKLYS